MKKHISNRLPESLRPYFWDVAFEKIDIRENPQFVLKRVIDRGNTNAIRWALSNFNRESIAELVLSSRDISIKTANFWADILDIDKKEVPCLQKPYFPIPFGPSN